MKIFYFANIRIPSKKAHTRQIMTMCESFTTTGAEVDLFVPEYNNLENVYSYYGIQKNFSIKVLKCFDVLKFRVLPLKYLFICKKFIISNFNHKIIVNN